MTALILPSRWTRQPQFPVEINWSNPITRGLADCGYGRYSVLGREFGTPQNATAVVEATTGGLSLTQTAGQTRGWTFTRSKSRYVNGDKQSVFLRANIRALIANSLNSLLCVNYSGVWSNPYTPLDVRNSVGGGTVGQFLTCTSGSFSQATSGSNWLSTSAGLIDYGIIRSANSVDFMRGGVVHSNGTLSASTTTDFSGTTGTLEICSSLGNEPADARVSVWAIWCRNLLYDEYAALSINPWQLFAPINRRLYLYSGGSTTNFATLAAAQSQAATTAKDTTKGLTSGQASTAVSARLIGKSLSATQISVAASARFINKVIALVQASAATLVTLKVILAALSATQGQVASALKTVGIIKAAVQGQLMLLSRSVGLIKAAGQITVIGLTNTISKVIPLIQQAALATLSTGKAFLISLVTAQGQSSAVTTAKQQAPTSASYTSGGGGGGYTWSEKKAKEATKLFWKGVEQELQETLLPTSILQDTPSPIDVSKAAVRITQAFKEGLKTLPEDDENDDLLLLS